MPSDAAETLLSELKLLGIQQKDALFACGGSVTLDKPVRIHYAERESGGSSSPEGAVTFPPDNDAALDRLVGVCEPAAFGKGKELVHDESYRSAFELPADRFLTSFLPCEHAIMSEIHRLLAPNAASVRAKLYKLNAYKQGGFFKAHVDTPRGGNMFGTLVVCLPSTFTGGDFEVKHNGQTHVFAWESDTKKAQENQGGAEGEKVSATASSATSKEATATSKSQPLAVRWCAFYSDCSHEVLEVKSGHRVTLTYLLENDDNVPRQVTSAIEKNPFVVKLGKLLKTEKYGVEGQQLGFALEHRYTIDGAGTVPMLKGFDRFLKAALDALGLQYKFVPVFLATAPNREKIWGSDEDLRERLVGQKGPEDIDIDDYEVYVGNWRAIRSNFSSCDYVEETRELEFLREILYAKYAGTVRWVVAPKAMQLTLHTARYGNEPLSEEYYAAAAFLATT